MKLSSAPRRRASVTTLLAAAAILAAFILPAAASADHQAQMAATSSVSSGCQPKGVFAQPAPGGGLAAGAYAYVVVATVSGIDVTPCPAVTTSIPGGPLSSVSLVWNAAPGATGYKVYRAPVNTTTGAVGTFTQVAFPPAQAPGCPRAASANANGGSPTAGNGGGSRCDAHDVNPSTAGAQLAVSPVGTNTQAGAAVDLKLTQCVDYGGARSACPFTPGAIDDPQVAWDGTNGVNALRTDDLHFPPGLNARPDAGTVCKLSDPAGPSLLGDPAKHGSADAFEDTCPAASQVGNATTLSRTSNSAGTYSLTRGDIYLGEAKPGEAARLYVVLRPNCSAGAPHPYNPGGPVCSSPQGLNNAALEVSKEFLATPSTFVRRADGTYGIDVRTVNAETDGPIPPKLDVLTPTGSDVGDIPVQVHQLTQTLFGTTSQNTPDSGDDRIFLTLPTSCGDHSLTADKTTYAHTDVSSASTNVPTTNCEALEFTPELAAVASGETAQGGHPALDVTVTQAATEAPSRSVKVTLPPSLGTNLSALNTQPCTEAELNADTCPDSKSIGTASASSPLSGTLAGKAYLQTNPGALPLLVVKLKGLINLDLYGSIDLAGGNRIVNLFSSIPDVPLTEFKLHINGGANGLLTNLQNLCDGTGNVDGEFISHSGKTVNLSVPLQLATQCVAVPNAIGVSRRAKVRIVLAKVKSGRPTLKVIVTRGRKNYASKITSARVILPRGLKIKKNDRLEARLKVKAGSNFLPITQLVVRTGLLTVNNISGGPVDKLTETFRRKSLRSSGALRRRGRAQRAVFRVRVRTFGKKTYNYRVRVRPRS